MKVPKFKSTIEKHFEVRVEGYEYVRNAKNEEQAKEFAKEMKSEAKKKWKEDNSKQKKYERLRSFINDNIHRLSEHLTKELYFDTRAKTPYVEEKKRIRDLIRGIIQGKKNLEWYSGYGNYARSYYMIKDTTKEERERMGVEP